jgi:hypothetical protein
MHECDSINDLEIGEITVTLAITCFLISGGKGILDNK